MISKVKLALIIFLFLSQALGAKTVEEKESELLDFSSIKNVLKSDGLKKAEEKREKIVEEIKKEREKIEVSRFNYPNKDDFFKLMSEYWLVKNAPKLSWDITRPKYGIEDAFKELLEKLGFYNVRFKVLIINSPNLVHLGLPAGKNEYIFILSLPFMRTLDLTKRDISLILLEDFFRLKNQYFISNLKLDLNFLDTNFQEKGIDKSIITKTVKTMSQVAFQSGFSFQQQYEVTKEMDSLLRSNQLMWNTYYRLKQKMSNFLKSDILFKHYLKIYPSPDLQIKWLTPKKKVI